MPYSAAMAPAAESARMIAIRCPDRLAIEARNNAHSTVAICSTAPQRRQFDPNQTSEAPQGRETRGEATAAIIVRMQKAPTSPAFHRPKREVLNAKEVCGFQAAHRSIAAAPASRAADLGVTS